jgi:Tol biopolymer transport system component
MLGLRLDPSPAVVPLAEPADFRAMAQMSDGTERDVTDQAVWSADPTRPYALVEADRDCAGRYRTLAEGLVTVRAYYDDWSGLQTLTASTTLEVVPGALVSIEVVPSRALLIVGRGMAFSALGTFANGRVLDISWQVDWSSSDPGVAAVFYGWCPPAWVEGKAPGAAAIQASKQGITGKFTIPVEVLRVTSVALTPPHWGMIVDTPIRTRQFTAKAIYNSGETEDVSHKALWESTAPAVAGVSGGLVSALALGSATVRATFGGVAGEATVEVTPPLAGVYRVLQGTPGSITRDGRFAACTTYAALDPGDANSTGDVYLWSRDTGALEWISRGSTDPSENPCVSEDGEVVVFQTKSRLVPQDQDSNLGVYVWRRGQGLSLVNVTPQGQPSARPGYVGSQALSEDGRLVLFTSDASDLVPGATSGIYLRDLEEGTTTEVAAGGSAPRLSGDGRKVALMRSRGTTPPTWDLFVLDRAGGSLQKVNPEPLSSQPRDLCLTRDGRFLAWREGNTFLLWDGQTLAVEVLFTTAEPEYSGEATGPALSDDARWVAFTSSDPGLVADDRNAARDLFVWDRSVGKVRRLQGQTDLNHGVETQSPWISGDGTMVGVGSRSNNLATGGNPDYSYIYLLTWPQ